MTTPTTDPCSEFNFDAMLLKHGAHGPSFTGEACLVECSNRLTVCVPELREKFGAAKSFGDDHPSISRVIRSFAIGLNDGIKDDQKRTDLLKPYAVKILGTKTNAKDETTRAWMATDWLVRVHAPAFLDLAGLADHASALRALPVLTDAKIARSVQQVINAAQTDAAAAGDAAGDAAWAAARDAARAAAGDAARDAAWAAAWAAAWDAAGDAAGDAAWAAAGDAARAAAGDAARAAAGAAAGDAAWDAARDAAWAAARDAARAAAGDAARDAAWAAAGAAARDAAWAAAGDAAREKLRPTVEVLQASALELLDAMIAVDSRPKAEAA
jgi:hypothetical protein